MCQRRASFFLQAKQQTLELVSVCGTSEQYDSPARSEVGKLSSSNHGSVSAQPLGQARHGPNSITQLSAAFPTNASQKSSNQTGDAATSVLRPSSASDTGDRFLSRHMIEASNSTVV